MADQQEPQQSHQLDTNDGSITETAMQPSPSITNTCYECLQHVFDYLDLKSLLNVAGTCRKLQTAVATKFEHKFGKKRIVISTGYSNQDKAELDVCGNYIRVSGIKFCLPLLRCFGAQMTDIVVFYSSTYWDTRPKHIHCIDQYISGFCADTLAGLTLRGDGDQELSPGRPFKNVKNLDIYKIFLRNGLSSIGGAFPNLRSLSINSVEYGNSNDSTSALHLPHLEHLSISLSRSENRIERLLQANHQLQSLEITILNSYESVVKVNKLLNMINGMVSLSKFATKMEYSKICCVDANELQRLAQEHPKLVEVHFERYLVFANDVVTFIGQLNALKKFRFQVKDRSQYELLMRKMGNNSGWQIKYQPDIITLSR